MSGETDAQLVAALRSGDRAAGGRLLERYLRATRSVALSILRDIESAEDVCQDAFVYAIERIDDCRDPARFAAWLIRIVRNRSLNVQRNDKTGRGVPIHVREPPSSESLPDTNAERSQIRERLLEALEHLPVDRRTVVLLHDLEGWTHAEIAERLELPAGTVRSHLHHARIKLRALLPELVD